MRLPPTEWLEKMIRIETVSHRSNIEVVRFLIPLIKEIGLTVEEQKVTENGETFTNLIAFNQSLSTNDLLVLNTHLDTVSAGRLEDWTKTNGDPFRATRVRDRFYGLGSADVKLDFLLKLWAAKHAKPWGRPFALVGTFGEERGLIGAMHLLREKRVKPRFALVGEPSNLELIYAHKGHLITTIGLDLGLKKTRLTEKPAVKRWKGKAAHSSTPELGDNAISKGLIDIFKRGYGIVRLSGGTDSNRIPDACEAEVISHQTEGTKKLFAFIRMFDEMARDLKKRRDTRFSPPISTLSLNQAETIDGDLQLTFDLRSLPDVDTVRWRDRLTKNLNEVGCRVIRFSQDEALRGNKNGRFMQAASKALSACGVTVVKKTKASSTEAALYNQHGAEAIVFGAGISVGNVHRPNEYNSLRQMGIATQFYTRLLKTPAEEL